MAKQIFVNLPVKNLKKTTAFFTALGFKFNKQFTNDKAGCLIIGKDIYAMLITEKFFKTFTPKRIADARKTSEVLIAIALRSRKEVDQMVKKALARGSREPRKPEEHGWMYSRSFEDPDGHIWEAFYADEKALKKLKK